MVPKGILSAFMLMATTHLRCEGRLGIPPPLNGHDVATEDAITTEDDQPQKPPSGTIQRHLLCTDHVGTVTYSTKYEEVETQCHNLANQAMKGVDIAPKCERYLVGMSEYWMFPGGGTVSDACPVACGMCDGPRDEDFGPPTTTSTSTTSTAMTPTATAPTRQPTENAGATLQNTRPVIVTPSHGKGEWGKPFNMELIAIHSMLLPDGCVLSYGTNTKGRQRADLYYEVWDPLKGTQEKAFELLEHSTEADIFCSTLNIDPSTGNIIIMGGDVRNPKAGLGIETVLEFDWKTHKVRPHPKGDMHYARWYGTSVNLPNKEIFIVGGRSDDYRQLGSPIPELWSPNSGFRTLKNAKVPAISRELEKNHWWYPFVYVNSRGEIIVIMPRKDNADVYRVDVEGDGDIEKIGNKPFEAHVRSPSIMFRIDQVAMLDDKGWIWVADISGRTPKWKKKKDLGDGRTNGQMTMLPDGRVVITGGAKSTDDGGKLLDDAVYSVQIWDPDTNKVEDGPRQKYARLYHSSAIIMQDGSIFEAGGGAPGPQKNQNGQCFFPDYLFDKDQNLLSRPSILDCPRNVENDDNFVILVDDTSKISRVTTTKSGANTHTRNCDTRWLNLEFEVLNETDLLVYTEGRNTMIPGLWLLNVLDQYGVPSWASIVGVDMAPLDT